MTGLQLLKDSVDDLRPPGPADDGVDGQARDEVVQRQFGRGFDVEISGSLYLTW